MERKPLILGAAYHGNRMPHHAREDMRDMMRNGMDLVVHMFSHTDWDRHKEKMREILSISEEVGLESWVDNWGLAGRPATNPTFSPTIRKPIRSTPMAIWTRYVCV